jgi:hypothetical protein
MKVTYTAKDGKTFDSEEKCIAHESFIGNRAQIAADIFLEKINFLADNWKKTEYNKSSEEARIKGLRSLLNLLNESGFFRELGAQMGDRGCLEKFLEEDFRWFFDFYLETLRLLKSRNEIERASINVASYYGIFECD